MLSKNSILSAAALSVAFAGGVVATRVADRNSGVEAQASMLTAAAPAPASPARPTARGLTAAPLPDLSEVAARRFRRRSIFRRRNKSPTP